MTGGDAVDPAPAGNGAEPGFQATARRASANGSLKLRVASGQSVRSRQLSRANYHQDLKVDLQVGGPTKNLLVACFAIMFGSSAVFGYMIGCLNQVSGLIGNWSVEIGSFTDPIQGQSLTTSAFIPGGMIGSFSIGFIADRIGRKKSAFLITIPVMVGGVIAFICRLGKTAWLLIAGRALVGIGAGMASQLAPMYLSEIAPINLRGAIGTGHQLFITIGILVGGFLGIDSIFGHTDRWQFLMLMALVPSSATLILLPFVPDSPRYLLLIQKDRAAAEKSLQFFRQRTDVDADMEEMETEMADTNKATEGERYTIKKLLTDRPLRFPLFIVVFLQIGQQLSGINAVMFYSKSVFESAGVQGDTIQYTVVATSAVNVVATVVTVMVMDKLGRRFLLIWPTVAIIITLTLLTVAVTLKDTSQNWAVVSIIMVQLYVVAFAVGMGPVPWMIGPELFRQAPRSLAMSCAAFTNWTFTFIVGLFFPYLQAFLKSYVFLVFIAAMVICLVFIYFTVPETKGKTFEEIANQFNPGDEIEVEEIVDDPPKVETN